MKIGLFPVGVVQCFKFNCEQEDGAYNGFKTKYTIGSHHFAQMNKIYYVTTNFFEQSFVSIIQIFHLIAFIISSHF